MFSLSKTALGLALVVGVFRNAPERISLHEYHGRNAADFHGHIIGG